MLPKAMIGLFLLVVIGCNGCAYLDHKAEIQRTLINRPELSGTPEQDVIDMFGLPADVIPLQTSDDKDETWVYRDKWYGTMNVRLINGVVTDVRYAYGPLSR